MVTPGITQHGPSIEVFPDHSKVKSLRDSILWMAGADDGVSNRETYTPSITNEDDINGNLLKLRRTYNIEGVEVEMQSGHAYYREHKGGSVQDFATLDEAESAVLSDFTKKLENNEIKLPHGGDISIELNGETLVYRPVWIEKRNMFSVNYFPQK